MELEIPAMLRAREQHFLERFGFHSARARMHRVAPEELAATNREALRAAAELADDTSISCLVREYCRDESRIAPHAGTNSAMQVSLQALAPHNLMVRQEVTIGPGRRLLPWRWF